LGVHEHFLSSFRVSEMNCLNLASHVPI
jgi:hypothetical protein